MFCCRCNIDKETTNFFNDKNRKTGKYPICKQCLKIDYKKNHEKIRKRQNQYHHKNKLILLPKMKERNKKWRQENKDKNCAKSAKYRASKLQATPKWANLNKIEYYYRLAKYFDEVSCGFVKHHVDHIIPLKGKNVCGLHVEHNLQILIDKHNIAKSNKMESITWL
jgi:hypothetical protein